MFVLSLVLCNILHGQELTFQEKFQTKFAEIGRYDVHYLKKGSGKPILLVHGGGTWMLSWRNVVDGLAQNHTVFACDMPGHGYTVSPENINYDLSDFENFIDAFLAYHGLEKVILAGHSWGGGWALYYAATHPEKVEKLVIIDGSGLDIKDVPEWELLKYPILGEVMLAISAWNRLSVKWTYKKVYVHDEIITKDLVKETHKPLKNRKIRRSICKIQRHCDWALTTSMMNLIKAPTLIIWGEKDVYASVKSAKKMAGLIPNSTLIVVPDSGHAPQEESALAVLNIIERFTEQ